MQQVAAWLVARPLHGVLALAATAALPIFGFVSSVILVLLVLGVGMRGALLQAAVAAAFVAVASLIGSSPAGTVLAALAINWMPALVLAVILVFTRSLVLTLQLSVIIAVAAMTLFYVAIGNTTEFWLRILDIMIEVWREVGQDNLADMIEPQKAAIAEYATPFVVAASWMIQVGSLVLGHQLYKQLPSETANYGRFQDLDFGRVIALTLAVTSVIAALLQVAWLQSVAFVMFAAFWLQGVAIAHWLHAAKLLHMFGIVALYVLMLVAAWISLPTLAVIGYVDAWFGFRRKYAARDKE